MSEHSPNCTCLSCLDEDVHMRFFASQCTDTTEPKPGMLYKLGCPCNRCTKERREENRFDHGYEH